MAYILTPQILNEESSQKLPKRQDQPKEAIQVARHFQRSIFPSWFANPKAKGTLSNEGTFYEWVQHNRQRSGRRGQVG